jgi:hypothetical protein
MKIANWKTTLAGVALILGAVADLLTQLTSGEWNGDRLIADYTAFTGGVGLIFAQDAKGTAK